PRPDGRGRSARLGPPPTSGPRMTAPLPDRNDIRIAVIGLGYVGLPLAAAFGRRYPTVGFDIDATRIEQLRRHHDHTLEMDEEELRASVHLQCTSDPADLAGCDVFIVTVPTPIDEFKRPDLRPRSEEHTSELQSRE